jgi:hypothetical protein
VVQDEFTVITAVEPRIEGLNILQNRRGGAAGVLEVKRPLHHGEVAILHGDTTHHQTALWVGVSERVLSTVVVNQA